MIPATVILAIGLAAYSLWAASTDFGVFGMIAPHSKGREGRALAFLVFGLTKCVAAMMLCVAAGFIWGRA